MMLFGAAPGIAEAAADRLRADNSGLRVVGFGGPSFRSPDDMDPSVLDQIREIAPDVLCVALGNPKQEHWIDQYKDSLAVPVMIGVGGALDFLAGKRRRAPQWIQRTGMEWVFRLVLEPHRLFRRYASCVLYFPAMIASQVSTLRRVQPSAPVVVEATEGSVLVRTIGGLDFIDHPLGQAEVELIRRSSLLTVDLTKMTRIDHSAAAALFALRAVTGHIAFVGLSPGTEAALCSLGLCASTK